MKTTIQSELEEMMEETRRGTESWKLCGYGMNQSQVVYFSQIIILYIMIITCILNLSLKNGDSNLWTALLSSAIGYILPAPKLKQQGKKLDDHEDSPKLTIR